jgi:transcription antitermination factor NusG
VKRALEEAQVECFWPNVARQVKRGRHKPLTVYASLLPGYVFAHWEADAIITLPRADFAKPGPPHTMHLSTVTGVVRVVGCNGQEPAVIPDSDIDSIRIMLSCGAPVQRAEYDPLPGDEVEIRCGPLTGWRGYVTVRAGKCQVRVQVETLGMAVSAVVDNSWLQKIATLPKPTRISAC